MLHGTRFSGIFTIRQQNKQPCCVNTNNKGGKYVENAGTVHRKFEELSK